MHRSPSRRTRTRRSAMRAVVPVALGAAVCSAVPSAQAAPLPAPSSPSSTAPSDDHHAGFGLAARTPAPVAPRLAASAVRGLDVSSHQQNVNWPSVAAAGAAFAYVKATEGTSYKNPQFDQQYNGSASAGLLRGAYHFALPDRSGGSAQADIFLANGGGWSKDGKTLPGALDIEYNPYSGGTCYGLSQTAMTNWISSFVERYKSRTGRYPAIYSTTSWWSQCTGNSAAFGAKSPLWIANYNGTPLPLPKGWSSYTIWQTADRGPFPGDQNVFNGSLADLRKFAEGSYTPPPPGDVWPTVQEGSSGYRVTGLQHLLNAHGAGLAVDGRFGPGTRAAVVSFQKSKALDADGIVGPLTWQALIITVQSGSSGHAVRAAQALLNAHGATLDVDGEFGPGTRAAVVSFQKSKALDADGIVGPDTWKALVD
ncbi:GH25 family lysozyme [Streptomyces sp. NPDC007991]|uniref:GH25 family lysozyme n=1 Tax=Streptomyces sp. NPDC007991 TaxID=3364803 RepID=UPI0036E80777